MEMIGVRKSKWKKSRSIWTKRKL